MTPYGSFAAPAPTCYRYAPRRLLAAVTGVIHMAIEKPGAAAECQCKLNVQLTCLCAVHSQQGTGTAAGLRSTLA